MNSSYHSRLKSIFIISILLFSPFLSVAQSFKVAGCWKWELYNSCKKSLDQKFNNGVNSYQIDSNALCYYNVRFGGHYFDVAEFNFDAGHLVNVSFYNNYKPNEVNEAKNFRESLKATFFTPNIYDCLREYINDDGFKCYELLNKVGLGEFSDKRNLKSEGVEVFITVYRGETKGNIKKIFTGVYYDFDPWTKPEDEI